MGVEFDIKKRIKYKLQQTFGMTVGGAVLAAGAGALVTGAVLTQDVGFDLSPATRAAAQIGAEDMCREMLTAQSAIAEQAGEGKVAVVMMDMATCRKIYEGPRP